MASVHPRIRDLITCRWRLSIRSQMALIALVAVLLVGFEAAAPLRANRSHYLERAEAHHNLAQLARLRLTSGVPMFPDSTTPPLRKAPPMSAADKAKYDKYVKTFYEIEIDYHIRMRDRYYRAALRPWLRVQPEPYPGFDRVEQAGSR